MICQIKRDVLHMACMVLWTVSCPAQQTSLSKSGKASGLMYMDSIPMEVDLDFDPDGVPEVYHCLVNTPVCSDSLCRLLRLDVYWDLLGNFYRFVVPESRPLTKWDHLEFTRDDYRKLEEILRDKNSLLGSVKDVNALFDPTTKKISEKVDAVTGATRETIKNAVVPGAVYSSYTLWHVVNGKVSSGIRQHTLSYLGPALIHQFLLSDNYHYHYEALDYLMANGYEGHLDELSQLLRNGDPFVTRTAVRQFPESWLEQEPFQSVVTSLLEQLDYGAQEIWLDRLMDVQVQGGTLEHLTSSPGRFSLNQLCRILELCDKNLSRLGNTSITQLGGWLQHDHPVIVEGTCQILEILARENKNARRILRHYEKNHDI